MKKVDSQLDSSTLEADILRFWKEENIFQKSLAKSAPKGEFVFYDGPPFATGLPHYGHLLQSIVKDIVPRYKTMQGYRVERQWGWDCHGLPIENLVERELGFQNKKEILEYGVERFNEKCREKVLEYAEDWKVYIEKIGRFVDMENPYFTMSPEYMESVWWVWKELWQKDLVYESYRTMHICPRCETTLAQAEVSDGYKDIKDLAVTVKFELVDEPGTYFLAWTTTPWTLPGNVALAVHKDIEYVKVQAESGELYILAKDLLESNFKNNTPEILEEFLGKELVGKKYLPPFRNYYEKEDLKNKENGWTVYHADFVSTEMGTGIAHEAPAFGEDDMALGKEHNLPWVQHVQMDGRIHPDVTEFAGELVKASGDHQSFDVQIIKSLAQKGDLFAKERYEHSYPHCWRCDTPLLNYATSSWFVAVEKIQADLLKNAENIHWVPAHVKEGRFGKWLEGARDWSVSRQRFWASCIPLWVCDCGEKEVFGSRQELFERSGVMVTDLHKHVVDAVTFPCGKCQGTMKRIPDVFDTWFDSGSMPYAGEGYIGEGTVKRFPADFIAEMVEQTRTWFYYQHVLGTALFDSPVFQNAVATGVILAEDGKKMSKKLSNYPDPLEVLNTHGADIIRLYITTSPVVGAENLHFSLKDVETLTRNTFRMLWNSYSFFTTYATIDSWSPETNRKTSEQVLDVWILAELQNLIEQMTKELEAYQLSPAARLLPPFIDNLSNWYIRRSRKRFWKNENDDDKQDAYQTLYTVLLELSKLMAPFTPFLAEAMYKNLTSKEPARTTDTVQSGGSVHLESWPIGDERYKNEALIHEMQKVRMIVTEGLKLRTEENIKVRQPLRSVSGPELSLELQEIVKEELNVKEYKVEGDKMSLDFELTPELRLEGEAREIIRAIQEGRKKAGFNVDDRITLAYQGKENVIAVFGSEIAAEVLAQGEIKNISFADADKDSYVNIAEEFTFWIKRV